LDLGIAPLEQLFVGFTWQQKLFSVYGGYTQQIFQLINSPTVYPEI
jgi:hypothetical protein